MKKLLFFICTILFVFSFMVMVFGKTKNDEHSVTKQYPALANQEIENKCLECHNQLVNKKMVHGDVKEDCTICHESNGNEHPKENVKAFQLIENAPSLCYNCHDEKNIKKHVHYPVSEGECFVCHDPHSSDHESLLLQENVSKLCAECHDVVQNQTQTFHQPYADGDCTACHDPHQSDNYSMLKLPVTDLCTDCHDDFKEMKKMSNVHPPFEEECTNCHSPHYSDQKKMLLSKVPDLCYDCHENVVTQKNKHHPAAIGDCVSCHSPHASNQERFLVKEQQELCLSCHSKTIVTDSTRIDNIGQLLKKEYVHGALESDGCITCHLPHSSEMQALLNDQFPARNYSQSLAENFSLCFNCHDESMITEEHTTIATEFRNKDKNLHYLHINGDKGRSCVLCHNTHGSDTEHLIRKTTQFGSWKMPVKYQTKPHGGSCATGCHSERTYDRGE